MLLVTTASKRRIQWCRGQAAGGGGRQRASRPMPAPMAGLPVLQVALIASLWCPQPALQPQDSGRQVLRRATPPKWVAPGTQTPGARCVERLMPLIDCCKGPAGLRKPRALRPSSAFAAPRSPAAGGPGWHAALHHAGRGAHRQRRGDQEGEGAAAAAVAAAACPASSPSVCAWLFIPC